MTYQYISQPEILIFVVAAIWVFFWKALALWHAARRNESFWYILFLVVNTLGIIEIVYLYKVVGIPSSSAALAKTGKSSKKRKK